MGIFEDDVLAIGDEAGGMVLKVPEEFGQGVDVLRWPARSLYVVQEVVFGLKELAERQVAVQPCVAGGFYGGNGAKGEDIVG